jgi:hypothetical protein
VGLKNVPEWFRLSFIGWERLEYETLLAGLTLMAVVALFAALVPGFPLSGISVREGMFLFIGVFGLWMGYIDYCRARPSVPIDPTPVVEATS